MESQMAIQFKTAGLGVSPGSDAPSLDRLAIHSQEIAQLALRVDCIGIDDGGIDVSPLAAKLGHIADLGASLCGGLQAKGGAEQWLLPRTYHAARLASNGAEVVQ
jgi:hypothetical protein